MIVTQQFPTLERPGEVRHSYRVSIESKSGQVIEIVEMDGGFFIAGVTSLNSKVVIMPHSDNSLIVEVK